MLAGSVNVCPVMLPGREVRLGEPLEVRVEEIVERLQAEVKGELTQPYAIYGHSMGALLAYAWARRIAEDHLPAPLGLVVSGRNAPQTSPGRRVLHELGDEEFVEALRAQYGGVPQGFLEDDDLREVFLPILRADLEVVETYRFEAGELLTCPVRAFAGGEDQSVSDEGLVKWGEVTSKETSTARLPGDHFSVLDGAGREAIFGILHELGGTPPG